MTHPNCQVGYHVWTRGPGYSECVVCNLIERDAPVVTPESEKNR